jgi:hypothetical protein
MGLREIQTTLADWIRAPEGVANALVEEDGSSSDRQPGGAQRRLEALIQSTVALDATGRLEIYANAYFQRILGVLETDYPVLRETMGAESFSDLVTSYILVEPSRHPSLRYAGRHLYDFLATHEAAAGVRTRVPWAAELAAFEWARIDVFDAADGETLEREALATIAPEEFGALVLCLGLWVRVRTFEYPVAVLWGAVKRGTEFVSPEPTAEPNRVVVWRQNETTYHRGIDAQEEAALAHLGTGIRFDALCEWTAGATGEDQAPAQAAAWLEQWLADGLLIPAD